MCRPVQEPQTLSTRQRLEQKLEAAGLRLVVQKTFVHCQVVGASAPLPPQETRGSGRRAHSDSSRFFETARPEEGFSHARSHSDSVVELARAASPMRARAPPAPSRGQDSCIPQLELGMASGETLCVTEDEWPAAPQLPACTLSVVTEDEWPAAPQLPPGMHSTCPAPARGIFELTAPQLCTKRTARVKRGRGDAKERTTLMFKNLPSSYLRPDVMRLLDEVGFSNEYNFVHVPVDCFSGSGLGYGFLNATSQEAAERLLERLQGFASWSARSTKVLEVCWGAEQGLRPLVARYRNSRMMHASVPEAYRPMLLNRGEPVAFPLPTKKILKPRCVAASHRPRSSASAA